MISSRLRRTAGALALFALSAAAEGGSVMDNAYKPSPQSRFNIFTGDGHYKQVYHWRFNENGAGTPYVVFLNHGIGGAWYRDVREVKAICDSLGAGLCQWVNGAPQPMKTPDEATVGLSHTYDSNNDGMADKSIDNFMRTSVVGKAKFNAWTWQEAIRGASPASPVHVFMVSRYSIATSAADLDNVLFWLQPPPQAASRGLLPPYNFGALGLDHVDHLDRPMHAAPDISAFDNVFLLRHLVAQFPALADARIVVEGRSDGGSAMIALAADPHIWTRDMRAFWERHLEFGWANDVPQPLDPFPDLVAAPTTPVRDLTAPAPGTAPTGNWQPAMPTMPPVVRAPSVFDPDAFRALLADYVGRDFYAQVAMLHSWYPGCGLSGRMQQDPDLPPGVVDDDGNTADGYRVALPLLFSFAADDPLWSGDPSQCQDRVDQALANTQNAWDFLPNAHGVAGGAPVDADLFDPAIHGFDYEVFNDGDLRADLALAGTLQDSEAEARDAVARGVNTGLNELGLATGFSLPLDLQ